MIEPGLLRIAANFVRSFVKATGAEHSESAELRNEYRDIKRDRWDARRDTRDVRHDRYWGWR